MARLEVAASEAPGGNETQRDFAEATWTIGTYNLLHPAYAVKYRERPGIDSEGKSNWSARAAAISRLLREARLDIYLLQEVGREQLSDLMACLATEYDAHIAIHPAREAGDGTAVLTRLDRFEGVGSYEVPLPDARSRPYMCAAATFARDRRTGLRLVILSAHLYEKRGKSHDPGGKILKFFEQCRRGQRGPFGAYDLAVWGGDCNRGYDASGEGPVGFHHLPGGPQTHPPRQIDWIFLSPQCAGVRGSPSTECFIESTRQVLPATGFSPSDHTGEAVAFSYNFEALGSLL